MDRIDLQILRLLQQRNKLTGEIGRIKQRDRSVIYVPEREKELLARLLRHSKGRVPSHLVRAIYREILSGSRAAQGQPPIGVLKAKAEKLLPAAQKLFGASDRFSSAASWGDLVEGVRSRALSMGLITGSDLLAALRREPSWREFSQHLTVANAVPISTATEVGTDAILTLTPPGKGEGRKANRFVILIECKSTRNAIKTLFRDMPDLSLHDESSARRPTRAVLSLACLHAKRPVDVGRMARRLGKASEATGVPLQLVGSYLAAEDYGG